MPTRSPYRVKALQMPFPLPADISKLLLENALYAQGNDFTNGFAQNPDYKGNSLLKRLWQGQGCRATEGSTGMRLWLVEHENKPVGVVAWLHRDDEQGMVAPLILHEVPNHPNHLPKASIDTAPLGYVMCYLHKDHRGQGLIRQIMKDHVVGALQALGVRAREQGLMPIVAAVDATRDILEPLTPLPVVTHPDLCQALRSEVWSLWTRAQMYPEINYSFGPFLVSPKALGKPRARPRR